MEVTLELSNLVEMQSKTHNVSYVSLRKILATGLPVAKTLIKYIVIALRKMKKKMNQLILSLLSKKLVLKLFEHVPLITSTRGTCTKILVCNPLVT